jgi:hypothetical protein
LVSSSINPSLNVKLPSAYVEALEFSVGGIVEKVKAKACFPNPEGSLNFPIITALT